MADRTDRTDRTNRADKGSADGDQRHKWVRILQLGAVLFLFWILLTGRFGLRMTITGVLSVVVTLMFYKRFLSYFNLEPVAAQGFLRILRFSFRVIRDIFASALAHMKRVIYGSPSPEMFTVTLTVKEPMLVALIANAITLTPGSMTVEVHGSELTVLAFVDGEEEVQAFRRQIHTRYEQLLMGGGPDA